MGGRLGALIVKELLAILRDPRGRLVLIGPPLLQLLIFSFAATLEVSNVDVVVLNRDSGASGFELVRRIEGSPVFRSVTAVDNPEALTRAIDRRRALAAIHIGPTFSRDIKTGRPAMVQVILDGRRSNAAQVVNGYLGRIARGLGADIEHARSGEPSVVPVTVRHWFNANLNYLWFAVPSLVAIIPLLTGLIVTALSVARERELGTFDQLMVTPLRTHEILIGKSVPPFLIGVVHTTLYVVAAIYFFGVPLRGSLIYLYLSLIFYLSAVVGVGLFISSLSSTQQQAILGAFVVAVPATLLSGYATPIENMPGWLQVMTQANPLRHFLVVVKGVFLKDLPASDVIENTLPMIVIAAVTLTASAWLFRRRLQ